MKHCGPLSTALVQAMCSACIEPPASCLTAISSKHHASCLECWQLDAVPVSSRAIINFNLSELEKGFLGILRPRTTSDGTLTNAQAVQYSLVMAGQVHIRKLSSGLPDGLDEVYIDGGRCGCLIVADTADVVAWEHITGFPGEQLTLIARFPVEGKGPPAHRVLHDGPCVEGDFVGM